MKIIPIHFLLKGISLWHFSKFEKLLFVYPLDHFEIKRARGKTRLY